MSKQGRYLLTLAITFLTVAAREAYASEPNCIPNAAPKEWFPALSDSHGLIDYNVTTPPGWGACSHFARATCCEKNHTDVVTRMLIFMDRAGFSTNCMAATEKSLCGLACDPNVGLGQAAPILCQQTCNEWREACAEEFVMPVAAGIQRMPMPCSDSAIVCSKLGDMFSTGAELCEGMSVRWSTEACITGLADPSRRGKIRPASTSTRSSDNSMPSLFEQFLRDFRPIIRWVSGLPKSYTRFIDKIFASYGPYLKWTLPAAAMGFLLSCAPRLFNLRDRDNDDFAR